MYVLTPGAPEDAALRQERERRCYRLLDGAGIPYMRMDHPAADNMEVCARLEKDLGAQICKNLFLCNRQQTDFYLLMMPGNKPFRTRLLSKALGVSRLSFAGEGFLKEFLDLLPGAVSILGLMNDRDRRVRLVADADLKACPFIGCHPCVNTSSLRIAREDMFEKLPVILEHPVTWVEMKEPSDPA